MTPGIRGTTRVVGVFGYPVKHSASPAMHNAAFAALGLDWVYVPFEVAPDRVADAMAGVRALNLAGVNVTVPLKERVAVLMDELTDRAAALKSVNTVIHRDDKLIGDSTDGPGFLAGLAADGVRLTAGQKAVVLGAGGSARAVVRALGEAGVYVTVSNRSEERSVALAREVAIGDVRTIPLTEQAIGEALSDAVLLINTTSVGMHPITDALPPVPADALHPNLFVTDLIYNPFETNLLRMARECGCRTQNGVEMLVQQGAISFQHWTGLEPPHDIMRQAVLDSRMRSAVL